MGCNEVGTPGNPGIYNWSLPETWTTNADLHLYVLVWDDAGPQSWIGEFTLPNKTLYSNLTDWEFTVASGPNPGELGAVPLLTTVQNDIFTGTWAAPQASAPNGLSPWGTIPGISSSANFIWHDTLGAVSTSDAHYVIFRTTESLVPLPPSMLLLGSGLLGLVGWRRFRKS